MTDEQLVWQYQHEAKVLDCASYMIEYGYTVRKIAEEMCVGKSTVHRWLTEDLKWIDNDAYHQCTKILGNHRRNAPYRGGKASLGCKKNRRSTQ